MSRSTRADKEIVADALDCGLADDFVVAAPALTKRLWRQGQLLKGTPLISRSTRADKEIVADRELHPRIRSWKKDEMSKWDQVTAVRGA